MTIYSELQAPNRNVKNIGNEFKALKFQTLISFSKYELGDIANVHTYQLYPSGDPRGDFDFIETIFDSPETEKIYGMGLQYTETNFKGKNVHVITSEGGVGRGLQPLTDMLNTAMKNQGGNTMTSYAPTYSFSTSQRRGFVFDHTEIGNIDFSQSTECFSTALWHGFEIKMSLVVGRSLKEVTQGITSIIGRMRALPAWTQDGAIVGL